MKETTCTSSLDSVPPIPEKELQEFHELSGRILERSVVVWGEHCTECAYPKCYASCAFYTPRWDMNCRRFQTGIESVQADGLHFMKIQFRQWGKLEGQGPTGLYKPTAARRREKIDDFVGSLILNASPTIRLKNSLARRWDKFKSKSNPNNLPSSDATFVIEAWTDNETEIPCTLTIVPFVRDKNTLFQTGFKLLHGYNRILTPVAEISAIVNLSERYLIQFEPIGAPPVRPVFFGLVDFAVLDQSTTKVETRILKKKSPRPKAKCVVWDLDNTLWSGTLAEDGIDGLALRPKSVEAIKALDKRGILHSIASKNDAPPTLAALEHFGIRDYFIFPQIGWGPKSQAIRNIAKNIDIDVSTLIFIDDQPFERGEVSENLPAVECLPDEIVPTLTSHSRLQVTVTAEASRRRFMYKDEESRVEALEESGSDYDTFLRSCKIVLDVFPLKAEFLDRAYELSQRTNQLNLSGTRYTKNDLQKLLNANGNLRADLMSCSDRFGDYGIIGLCVFDIAKGCVESFMMSCRVQRKRVENAYFSCLAARIEDAGHKNISVRFRPTERNAAATVMLTELAFEFLKDEDSDAGIYKRKSALPFTGADIVNLEVASLRNDPGNLVSSKK